jgi:hypothetical protein
LVTKSRVRMACERILSAPIPPACERAPSTSILYTIMAYGVTYLEGHTKSTGEVGIQETGGFNCTHVEEEVKGGGSERMNEIWLWDETGATEIRESGRNGARVTEAEVGRRMVGARTQEARGREAAWRTWRMWSYRGTHTIHIILSITTITFIIAVNFADTPMGKQLVMDLTKYILIVTSGARAPGVAATPRRYRPLALPTQERGVWLTLQAWLRRATVSGYTKFLITPWLILGLLVRELPLATARARAMCKGWAAMVAEAAEAARSLAPARSWFGVYGTAPAVPLAIPEMNLAAVSTDEFLKGKTGMVVGLYTPLHSGGGLVTASYLTLVVCPPSGGGETARLRSGTFIIIALFL